MKNFGLLGSSALRSVAFIAFAASAAAPAFAQDATNQPHTSSTDPRATQAGNSQPPAPVPNVNEGNEDDAIVVTGTMFRRTNSETASPVTTLSQETLQERGINTVEEALTRLSANNAGSMPNAWNAQGNFAQGASAVSLRGLTTNSTLVLFDGLRMAYYPLADDGTRNFVDLNTIPDASIEKIEVLKDGASSSYGADAIAGVVNIITRRQLTGVHFNASAGISQRGDAAEQRVDLSAGVGDLDKQGFNIYVVGEYQRNHILYNHDRGYPYNTSDLSKLCGVSNGQNPATLNGVQRYPAGSVICRTNNIANGIQFDNTFAGFSGNGSPVIAGRAFLAPTAAQAAAAGSEFIANTAVVGARNQYLNPAAGCWGNTGAIGLTPTQLTNTNGNTGATAPSVVCTYDPVALFGVIQPNVERAGATARMTARVTDDIEAYAMVNYFQTKVQYTGTPNALRANLPAGGVPTSTANLALPVWVCAAGVNCSTAADRKLNPNNPFAAQGQVARIVGRYDTPTENQTTSRAYRGAVGVHGTVMNDWLFNVDVSASRVDLHRVYKNYIYAQHLLDVIGQGTYNFLDQRLNSQSIRDYLAPTNVNNNSSQLFTAQANLAGSIMTLPGGPLQLGVGVATRYEAVNNPSSNPVVPNKPFERYFVINGTGFKGSRWVQAAYAELDAPILDQIDLNLSGRYDHYSSGQSAFSPKAAIKITPIRQIALRATWSKGFRIPSFAEANGLPTTGYVFPTPPASFAALHGGNAYGTAAYALGLTSVGTPGLKPEKSRNMTLGAVFQPVPWASFTVDYYDIKKTSVIAGADYAPALTQYYANNGVCTTPGLTCIAAAPDPAFPNALPLLGFIEYGFQNANQQRSRGIDAEAEARIPLMQGVRLITSAEVTYLIELSQVFEDGTKQRYDGTLGPYQITSASGAPKWRGSWQNTLDFGNARLTGTLYYTGGYGEEAEDAGGVRGVCGSAPTAVYRDSTTPVVCKVKRFINLDMTGSIDVSDNFTFYANVLNVLDKKPPYDPTTYGGYNYNPAWAQAGIVGRYFRFGARVKF